MPSSSKDLFAPLSRGAGRSFMIHSQPRPSCIRVHFVSQWEARPARVDQVTWILITSRGRAGSSDRLPRVQLRASFIIV
jgi:hypothetical protein